MMASEWKRVERNISRSEKTGLYRVHVSIPARRFERDKKTIPTLTEARKLRDEWRVEADLLPADARGMSLDTFFNSYFFKNLEKSDAAASTVEWVESTWRLHVSPALGQFTLDALPIAHDVQKLMIDGLTYSVALASLRVLRSVINEAAANGFCVAPAWASTDYSGWRIKKRVKARGGDAMRDVWDDTTVLEAAKILTAHESPLAALFCVAAGAGLRVDEALALDWGDLQFDTVEFTPYRREPETIDDVERDWHSPIVRIHIDKIAARSSKANNARRGLEVSEVEQKTKTEHSERWVTITPPFSQHLRLLSEGHDAADPICSNFNDKSVRLSAPRVNAIWSLYFDNGENDEENNEQKHKERVEAGAKLRWQITLYKCALGILPPDAPRSELINEREALEGQLDGRREYAESTRIRKMRRLEKINYWLMADTLKKEEREEMSAALDVLEEEYEKHKKKKTHHGKAKRSAEKQILKAFPFMQFRLTRACHNSACRAAGIADDDNELFHGRTPKTTGGRHYQLHGVELADNVAKRVHRWRFPYRGDDSVDKW